MGYLLITRVVKEVLAILFVSKDKNTSETEPNICHRWKKKAENNRKTTCWRGYFATYSTEGVSSPKLLRNFIK